VHASWAASSMFVFGIVCTIDVQNHVILVICYSTVPSVPTDLFAEALSHDKIKITWGPVADNGGADVHNYVLKVTEMDTETVTINDRQLKGDQMETAIDSLKSKTDYW